MFGRILKNNYRFFISNKKLMFVLCDFFFGLWWPLLKLNGWRLTQSLTQIHTQFTYEWKSILFLTNFNSIKLNYRCRCRRLLCYCIATNDWILYNSVCKKNNFHNIKYIIYYFIYYALRHWLIEHDGIDPVYVVWW